MRGITRFVILDILKNRVILFYTIVLAAFSWSIFNLEDSTTKSVMSLLNIILLTVPLVAIIFSNIYIYNSAEFIELLVSQPVKRKSIWLALFMGISMALNTAFILGIGIPVLFFIPGVSGMMLIVAGLFISTIFIAIAMLCSILMRDKARGIGLSIIIWLLMTLIYDGVILYFMFQFADYPIEKPMAVVTAINPIDLARIQVLLQLDSAALMGYTGAIFKKLFGTTIGISLSVLLLLFWICIPLLVSLKLFSKKDL
ncbi:MAG: ABC transporter permease subunit [Saprospiraceae bacterium]